MKQTNPVELLSRVAAAFGPEAARHKLELLGRVASLDKTGARHLAQLHDVLCFLRAYPDEPRVLEAVERVSGGLRALLERSGVDPDSAVLADTGFPGARQRTVYSRPFLERMLRLYPDGFEIDWDELEDVDDLNNVLGLLVTSGECQGLDDIRLDLPDWFAAARSERTATDLEFLLSLFATSTLGEAERDVLFELCRIPVRHRLARPGTGRCEIHRAVERIHFQRTDPRPPRGSLAARVRRPPAKVAHVSAAEGKALVELACRALCARNLEIRILSYANERDVWLVSCGGGLEMAVIGVVPGYRDPLENHSCVLVLKNGVPIGYGPATVWFGCCELGLNIFPEMRTREASHVYAQFMRAAYHVLGARYFLLSIYAMGQGNPAAIRTGVFWFYRKLGFGVTNPEVETLAGREEAKMRADPSYRCDRATLRRLARTEGYLDLSGGECRPLDLGALGVLQSRFLARESGDDRRRSEARCIRRARRMLGESPRRKGSPGERRAWSMLAPLLCMLPDLGAWSAADKRELLRFVRAKGARCEIGVDRLMSAHQRFRTSVRTLVETGD